MNVENLETINKSIIETLISEYVKQSEEMVKNHECPPAIYAFVNKYFRKIEGHDSEWYQALQRLRKGLSELGYKVQYRRQDERSMSIFDYEYWYSRKLDVPNLPGCLEEGFKLLSKLDPRFSSENAIAL